MITYQRTTSRGAFSVTVEFNEQTTPLDEQALLLDSVELVALHVAAAEGLREVLLKLVQPTLTEIIIGKPWETIQ